MARTDADINRACTPMHYIEENLDETRESLRQKKKTLESAQNTKSPFLVGSIEEVNQKISNLDKQLQSYTDLVIESRASQHSDDLYVPPPSAKVREAHQKKEKEIREVNRFAGLFSIKSTFLNKPNERVKNISKISLSPNKTSVRKDTGKPKFVELHQYPGFDSGELTALPHDTFAIEVLTNVANAQPHLKHKVQYRPEFERLFYSQMSQAVLQDIFWWIFLEKWQPNAEYQKKLFNRVAHNYVKLLMYGKHPQYRETFLRDYPSLLSQAVYAGFCTAFPDSYRMFDEPFKEDLIALVYEWVAGNRPAPRIWMSWNFEELEPAGLKQREKLIKQSKAKKSSALNLDFLDQFTTNQNAGSESTLNQAASMSSISSFGGMAARGRKPRRSTRVPGSQTGSTGTENSRAIGRVAQAQLTDDDGKTNGDTLAPIHEFDEEEDDSSKNTRASRTILAVKKAKSPAMQSHPVGKGADYVKGVFNTYGQSPLVAHFLRMKRLQIEAGLHARVQRTEIHNLPPLDAPTYKDLIQESFKKVKDMERKYNILDEKDKAEQKKFVYKQKRELAEHKRREAALMSSRREVKRISDLIMLELKKDQDSIGTGIGMAIDAALVSLDERATPR